MMRPLILQSLAILSAIFLLARLPARAAEDLEPPLSRAQMRLLQQKSIDLNKEVVELIFEQLKQTLTPQERRALGNPRLECRKAGRAFSFFATHTGGGEIIITEPGLRSVAQMSVLMVMTEQMGDGSFLTDYLCYVRKRMVQRETGFIPDPLRAAGWTYDDLSDAARRKNAFTSVQMYTFILAHEMAHIIHRHAPNPLPTERRNERFEESRRDELAADRFAFEMLARLEGPPTAALLLHTAQMMIHERGGDQTRATHPAEHVRAREACRFALNNLQRFTWSVYDPETKVQYDTDPEEAKAMFQQYLKGTESMANREAIEDLDRRAEEVTLESLRRPRPRP